MKIACLNTRFLTRSPLKARIVKVDSPTKFWVQLHNSQRRLRGADRTYSLDDGNSIPTTWSYSFRWNGRDPRRKKMTEGDSHSNPRNGSCLKRLEANNQTTIFRNLHIWTEISRIEIASDSLRSHIEPIPIKKHDLDEREIWCDF